LTLSLPQNTGARTTVPAERIAYVGFHRGPTDPPPLPSARQGSLKVHLSGSKTFLVDADATPPGAIGFYASPSEPESPFREIFFYSHGVALREINEPLGEMLVKTGKVGSKSLEKGLAAQREQQRTPIGQILVEQKKT